MRLNFNCSTSQKYAWQCRRNCRRDGRPGRLIPLTENAKWLINKFAWASKLFQPLQCLLAPLTQTLAHASLSRTSAASSRIRRSILTPTIPGACRSLVPNSRARGARARGLERRSLTPMTIRRVYKDAMCQISCRSAHNCSCAWGIKKQT